MDRGDRDIEEIKEQLLLIIDRVQNVFISYGPGRRYKSRSEACSLYFKLLLESAEDFAGYVPDSVIKEVEEWDDSKRSRLKTEILEKEGWVYKLLTLEEEGKEDLLFIHPLVLGDLAEVPSHLLERGCGILSEAWRETMDDHFERGWLSPVEGWISDIAYANVIGWIHYLGENIKNGLALFLTPHLSLLKRDFLRNGLKSAAREYNIKMEFLCFRESLRGIDTEEEFTFHIIDEDAPCKHNRKAIFEDNKGKPIFGFEVLRGCPTIQKRKKKKGK